MINKMDLMEKRVRSYGFEGEFYRLSNCDIKFPVIINKVIPLEDDGLAYIFPNEEIIYYNPLELICVAYGCKYELLAFRMYSRMEWIGKVANIQLASWSPPPPNEHLILLENNIDIQKNKIERKNKCMSLKKPYDINDLVHFFKAYYMKISLMD